MERPWRTHESPGKTCAFVASRRGGLGSITDVRGPSMVVGGADLDAFQGGDGDRRVRSADVERARRILGSSRTFERSRESSTFSFNRPRDLGRRTCVPMANRPASPPCSIEHGLSMFVGSGALDMDPLPALPNSRAPRVHGERVRPVPTRTRDALALPMRADSEPVPPSPKAGRALALGRRSYLPQLGARSADERRGLWKFN